MARAEYRKINGESMGTGADRPGGILGVSRCALSTNITLTPRASNKKQLSFYYVVSKLNNEK